MPPSIEEIKKLDDPTSTDLIDEKDYSPRLTSPASGEPIHSSYTLAPPPYDVKSGEPIPVIAGLPEETQQFTFRAVAVGCLLGSVVQASNIYLGLKTGFTFGASLFGALFGYALLKPLSRLSIPLLGGYFGPRENCTVQTAATASGGLGILFVSGVPAMYQLGLLSANPKDDVGKLILFTMAGAFFGMAFAIPMRKHYILRQKLVFPTPTATALAIHGLHSGPEGEAAGKKQAICLGVAFLSSISLRVVSQYIPGIVWDWHWGWWLYKLGAKGAIAADNWTWFLEFTPAFLGCGILSGLNASLSFYLGTVLAWGILGPVLVARGVAFGLPREAEGLISYQAMNAAFTTAEHPSPRYWLLWPGVMLMIVASFTELGMNGRKMLGGLLGLASEIFRVITRREKKVDEKKEDDIPDPAEGQLVPVWAWASLLVASVILTCVVMKLQFHVRLGVTILAIFLGFLFSFIGVQSSGDTDINPISTCAKASQLLIGGATRSYSHATDALTVNLLSGMLAGAAANQTTDMVGDLRTGHLLGASPASQFYSQFIGAFFSIVLAPTLFILFSQAYPCIIDLNAKTCEFGAPSVGAWRAVAIAVTSRGPLPIPRSSWIFAICFSILGMLITIGKYKLLKPSAQKWVPNMNAVGLGFIVNFTGYASAMAIASILTFVWQRKSSRTYELYAYSLAAGLMSGEGLGGVVNALFAVLGIDGSKYGSAALCPGNVYCG